MNKFAFMVAVVLTCTQTWAGIITDTFSFTGGFQSFTVPAGVTELSVDALGAQGGGSRGGMGAFIHGTIAVTPGETLTVLVGGQGFVTNQGSGYGAGGGGGTFVYRSAFDSVPLFAAGGGGGQSQNAGGGHGSATSLPTPGNGTGSGLGGVGGNGGAGGLDIASYSTAGGGTGWLTDGLDGLTIRNPKGEGGQAPHNGALGGIFTHRTSSYHAGTAGDGGFGGGGGMSDNSGAGGGGGGYNGGGGGNNYTGNSQWGNGGGGGSFNGGLNQTNIGGYRSGNGEVRITYVPEPSSLALLGLIGVGVLTRRR